MPPDKNPPASNKTDYRLSHLARGSSYDEALSLNSFDSYMAKHEAQFLRAAIPSLYKQAPTYIDFACGTGRIIGTVAPMSKHAIGIDVSPSMLREAKRKHPGIEFIEADITKTSLQHETVDLVTSFRFLGNADDDLRCAGVQACNRLLKLGGYFIINNHRNPLSIAALLGQLSGMKHEMDLTYFKLKRLLRRFGFQIVHQRAIGFWMYRARLMATCDDSEPRVQRLETWFKSGLCVPFAPDAVIVARKITQA